MGKVCGWKHPSAPSVKWLWGEKSTEAVLVFFGSARVGCNSTRRRFPGEGGGYEEAGACDEGMKVGRAR